jgi:Holliday junction resolvase
VRRAAKRDETEPAIIAALEAEGWEVSPISDEDVPDLLCSRGGEWMVIECKSKGGRLTEGQRRFIRRHKAPVWIVSSAEEAAEVARSLVAAVRMVPAVRRYGSR